MFVSDNMPPTYKHPRLTMKRTLKAAGVLAAVMFLLLVTGAGGALADTAVFYARILKLYTQEPHARIKMPVEDVTKREVANTWGAPRSGGRTGGRTLGRVCGSPAPRARGRSRR